MWGKMKNCVAYACIILCTFFVGMQNIVLPGVYFDAVYPDYVGAVGAFPGQDNFTQITAHLGLPLLGNFYHGTITAGIQYLVLKCAGHASVYTLRMVNLTYVAALGCLVFFIINKAGKQFTMAFSAAILCVTAENIYTMSRTQFYIMLPGAIFFLLSICFLFDLIQVKSRGIGILLAGLFQGFAFYGYFSYLFMAPVSLVLLRVRDCEKEYTKNILLFANGILIGSIGYFCGYYDSAVVNFAGRGAAAHLLLYIGVAIMIFSSAAIAFVLLKNSEKIRIRWNRKLGMFFACGVVLFVVGVVAVYGIAGKKIQSLLNVFSMTQNRGGDNGVLSFWLFLAKILQNRSGWELMFGKGGGQSLNQIWIYVWATVLLLTGVVFFLHPQREKKRNVKGIEMLVAGYSYLIGYFFTSLPFIKNMQQQHFVILYFGFFVLLGLHGCYLLTLWKTKATPVFAFVLIAVLCGVNVSNDRAFLEYLRETEGVGKYSKTVDTFIETEVAKGNYRRVYVFPEWGFYANFVYLTSNRYEAVRDVDIRTDILQQKMDDGCELVIVAWDADAIDEVLSKLRYSDEETRIWYTKQGEPLFTSISLSK